MLVAFSICIIYGSTHILKYFVGSDESILHSEEYYSWIPRFLLNFLSYSTVLLPGYLIYKYVRITKYLQRKGT